MADNTSLLALCVDPSRSRELFAFAAEMIIVMRDNSSFADPEAYNHALMQCEALMECRCPRTCAAALGTIAFWWVAMINRDSAKELILHFEPPNSVWRKKVRFQQVGQTTSSLAPTIDLLFKFVHAHILSIKNDDMDRNNSPIRAKLFQIALHGVIEPTLTSTGSPSADKDIITAVVRIMVADGSRTEEKLKKSAKPKTPKPPRQVVEYLAREHERLHGHLQVVQRNTGKKKPAAAAAPGPPPAALAAPAAAVAAEPPEDNYDDDEEDNTSDDPDIFDELSDDSSNVTLDY